MSNDEIEVTDRTINNECSKCGQCCGMFIPVTNKEVKEIKRYVKSNKIERVDDRITIKGFEARCCFLDLEEHKCRIYPVRPFVCRDFMCNHKDWKERRDKYDARGTYNSYKNRYLASFDELIYNDIQPMLQYICGLIKDRTGKVDKDLFIQTLKLYKRDDILDKITIKTEEDEVEDRKETDGKIK